MKQNKNLSYFKSFNFLAFKANGNERERERKVYFIFSFQETHNYFPKFDDAKLRWVVYIK